MSSPIRSHRHIDGARSFRHLILRLSLVGIVCGIWVFGQAALNPVAAQVVIAQWTFVEEVLTVEAGHIDNQGATLEVSGDRNITWANGSTPGTSAANATGWNVGDGYWHITISTVGYSDITLTSLQGGSGTGPKEWQLQYRVDAEAEWTDVPGGEITADNNWVDGQLEDLSLPSDASEQSDLQIRWLNTSDLSINNGTVGGAGTSRMDHIIVKGDGPVVPLISLAGVPLGEFSAFVGEPSASASYTVSGTDLAGDITATAPAGFEVSLDDSVFGESVVLNESGGEVDEVLVFVRLTGDAVGEFGGPVTHTSPDAFSVTTQVSGSVANPILELFVSADPTLAETVSVLPNDTWGDTGYDNDWSYEEGEMTVYIVPHEGHEFYAVSLTVAWDEAMLVFAGAGAGDGLFGNGAGTFFHHQLGEEGSVVIDAARLDSQNVLINNLASGQQYIAELNFTLVNPGSTNISIVESDVRATDGIGGQEDVPSEVHDGSVLVLLGDVGAPGDESTADGLVDFEDLILFAAAYWSGVDGGPEEGYKVKYDIGPTADGTVFTMPQVDGEIQFEDLVIFAISHGLSMTGGYDARPYLAPVTMLTEAFGEPVQQRIGVTIAPARVEGEMVHVPVGISGATDLRALSVEFAFDDSTFEVVGARPAPGGIVPADAVVFSAATNHGPAGLLDAARLGVESFVGSGDLVEIILRTRHAAAADFDGADNLVSLEAATLRNSFNDDLEALIDIVVDDGLGDVAFDFELLASYPNPAAGTATIGFTLPEASPVRLVIYDALGRQVMTLVDGERDAGLHQVELDTNGLASGTYLYRIEAGSHVDARMMTVLR